jgi:hypothetical protein
VSDRTERPPERVDAQFVPAGSAPEIGVKRRLDPRLTHLVAGDHTCWTLLELLLRHLRDIAEQLRSQRAVRIVAQERVLETEPAELVLMFLQVVVLDPADRLLHDHRRQRVSFALGDPFQHLSDRHVQDLLEAVQLAQS